MSKRKSRHTPCGRRSPLQLDVVDLDDPLQPPVVVRHEQRGDLVARHHLLGLDQLLVGRDGLGMERGDVAGADVEELGPAALHRAADVAVGDDALDAVAVADDDQPQPALRYGVDHLRRGAVGRHDGQVVVAHHVAHGHQQAASQAAARVQAREVDAREVALLHERHGQRVAHGDLRRGRARGREVEDAGLLPDAHVEVHVRVAGQRRVGLARHRDQAVAVGVDEGYDLQDLVGLARVGEGQHHVLLRDHAQVAVEGLARVEEEARRAGRGERCGDLAAHQARLAHARDDALARAGEDRLHGLGEGVAQPLLHLLQRQHLGVHGAARHLHDPRLFVVGHHFIAGF